MRRLCLLLLSISLLVFAGAPAQAQEAQQESPGGFSIFTRYPSQMAEIGETVTFELTLRTSGSSARVVELSMDQIPDGWSATFSGGGRVIQSVHVRPEEDATVSLKLEPPEEAAPESYNFVVEGRSGGAASQLPLELTLREQLPSRLAFDVELPILKGSPSTTFGYDTTLRNEGDQEVTVNLQAAAPEGFQVKFQLSGKEVTSFPIGAGESKRINVEVVPHPQAQAKKYQIVVQAQGGDIQEEIPLVAEITGQAELALATANERLSGEAEAGSSTPFQFVVSNNGSAPARNVSLSASPPNGWEVNFEPAELAEIAPGQQAQVTAHVKPSEKAIAGDYMLTVNSQAEGLSNQSVDLRVTVVTSTLWGIVGVVLIAVAVGVVGMAVTRFGRR